jgi:hypothetical protein
MSKFIPPEFAILISPFFYVNLYENLMIASVFLPWKETRAFSVLVDK